MALEAIAGLHLVKSIAPPVSIETRNHIGGSWFLEAADTDEALEW